MRDVVVVSSSEEVDVVEEKDWKKKKKKGDEEIDNNNNKAAEAEGEVETTSSTREVVRWEKLLPKRMVLRVLLVEADDSTRQVITALLRKCSYRVTAVADGLMAWETLKGRPHNIDLILTEVDLPSISGYALLTLVTEHEVCKNIPVVMMSSQDSISTVLKCMLKGAADFLIKPVRRNELRNLWQHVWRRQSLNAGLPQSSMVVPEKVEATSENNGASNYSSDGATSSTKNKDCGEEESDDAPGLLARKSASPSNLSSVKRQKHEGCAKLGDRLIHPESISRERSNNLAHEAASCNETYCASALRLEGKIATVKTIQNSNVTTEYHRANNDVVRSLNDRIIEPPNATIDLIGAFDSVHKHSQGSSTCLDDGTNKSDFPPQLELSLTRIYPSRLNNQGGDERHALNHSHASAFSLYTNKTLQQFFPISSSICFDAKDDAPKSPKLPSDQLPEKVNASPWHASTSTGNQETLTTLAVGQSDRDYQARSSPQSSLISMPGIGIDNLCSGNAQALPPLYYPKASLSPAWSPKVPGNRESPFPSSASISSNPENIDTKENCNFSDETTTNNSVDQNPHQKDEAEPVEKEQHGSNVGDQSASSTLCNGSANDKSSGTYGSLCSTNDGNDSLVGAAQKAADPESLNGTVVFKREGIRGMDPERISQREAALTKFRLKRKDRCFEKKVRYQSRKKLAEQRPRVKGQFVRQMQNGSRVADANG